MTLTSARQHTCRSSHSQHASQFSPPAQLSRAAGSARSALGAVCCGAAVALAPATVPPSARQAFAHSWCVHELLLRRLALTDRARQLPEAQAAQDGLVACLDTFHSAAAALLSSRGAEGLLSCPSLADWLDGRMLWAVALSLGGKAAEPLQLAPVELAELQPLFHLVQQAAMAVGGPSCQLAQLATAAAELSPAGPQEPEASAPEEPVEPSGRREALAEPASQPPPFSSTPLVQAICGPSAGSDGSGVGQVWDGRLAASLAIPDTHWHSGKWK